MEENGDINNHMDKCGNDVEMMRGWCEKVRSVPKVSEALLECKTSARWRKRRSVGENVGALAKTSEQGEKHRSEGKNIGEASERAVAIGEGSGVITCLSRYVTSPTSQSKPPVHILHLFGFYFIH